MLSGNVIALLLNHFQMALHDQTCSYHLIYPLMIKEPSETLNTRQQSKCASLHLITVIWTNFNSTLPASLMKPIIGPNDQLVDHYLVSSFPARNSPSLRGVYKLINYNGLIVCFLMTVCYVGLLHAFVIKMLHFTTSLLMGG